jgi:hypothetical protein
LGSNLQLNTIDLRKLNSSKEVTICTDEGYFPVLVNPEGEKVVAVVRGGAGHVGITGNLKSVISNDAGETWEEPIVIVDSEVDDRNPAIGIAPDGSILLAYHTQGSYDEDGKWDGKMGLVHMLVTNSPDGREWAEPWSLGIDAHDKHSPFGRIITLQDGTLLQPLYGDGINGDDPSLNHSYLVRSSDNGNTWGESTLIAPNQNETALALLPNGELLAAMRTSDRGQKLTVSRSSDGGYSWSEPVEVTSGREHPADLTVLSNGWILMVFGVRHEPFGVHALVSQDNGRTWKDSRLIVTEDMGNNDLGYPSTVRIGSRLVTAYYCAPRIFEPEFLGEGAFARALLYLEDELIDALDD